MGNEPKQQNVSQEAESLAKQKFLTSMGAISKTYKKAENSDILPSISKYTAKARGERLGEVCDDLLKSDNVHSLHTGNLIAKAGNLLGDVLDNAGVDMLQKIGMSKKTLKKNVENIVNAAQTLGHDISGPVSDFLERSKDENQTNIQHDDFTMRPS